jgi:predicted lipid-binding transport protein (Tim44 family)
VQQAWEARDYSPVRDLLMPGILAEHEGLLQSMRANHEVNRIVDLRIERQEFMHLSCPGRLDMQEVTALLTFRARVYFIDERTGLYTCGSRSLEWFQEFWTFRRQGDRWLLQAIERSHESDRLQRANLIDYLSVCREVGDRSRATP